MGVVYHALHESLKRDTALKVIDAEVGALPEFRTRFEREARAAAAVAHPNVLPIYDAGEDRGRLYLAMRYVDGMDLGQLLEVGGPLPFPTALAITTQVAGALDAAHALGIVHRDVKPGNVLLEWRDDEPRPYLADFGLTTSLTDDVAVTRTGAPLGTVSYAAPEQLEGGPTDARADVYALGCVLFHMLSGTVPFPRETYAATLVAQLTASPPRLPTAASGAPAALADVIARALAKRPDDRYPSAGALADAALRASGAAVAAAPVRPLRAQAPLPFPKSLLAEHDGSAFAGRGAVLEGLQARLEQLTDDQPEFTLLCGEPGIGKTRAATEFARRAHAAGTVVLHGRCAPDAPLPYQPFLTALEQALGDAGPALLAADLAPDLNELSRVLPELRRRLGAPEEPAAQDGETARYRLFDAVARVLAGLSQGRKGILVLDDLQWADASTTQLLRHLIEQAGPAGTMVIGTLRDQEPVRSPLLADLLARLGPQRRRFDRVRLEGLDRDAIGTLVGGAADHEFVGGLRRATNGNPLFLHVLLRSLHELGLPQTEQAIDGLGVPAGASELINRRVLRLGESTRALLRTAAIIGPEFDVDLLSEVADREPGDVIDAVEEAAAAGLVLADDADVCRFAHALVADELRAQQSPSRRMRVHDRVAGILEQRRDARSGVIALHAFEARRLDGGARAARWCAEAGREAAESLAYEAAAGHFDRALAALDLGPGDDDGTRCDLLLALGGARSRGGSGEARSAFRAAATLAAQLGDAERLSQAAIGMASRYPEAGVVDRESIALLEQALAALSDDSPTRVEILARLVDALQFTRDDVRVSALSLEALELARDLADRRAVALAIESRHAALLHIEHLPTRLELGAELLEMARDVGDRELEARARHRRIYDLLEAADVPAALREHALLTDLAEALRQPLYAYFAAGWRVVFAQMDGRIVDTDRLAGEAYMLGVRAGARDADTVYAAQQIALRRREERLAEFVETVEISVAQQPALVTWHAVLPLAHLAAGRWEEARAEFERLAADDFAAVPRDMFWFAASCVLAETCSLMGDAARAQVLYDQLAPFERCFVQVTQAACWGSTERFLGLLKSTTGEWDRAIAHLESAITRNTAAQCPAAAMVVRRDLVRILLRRDERDDRAQAERLLRETLTVAEDAGMNVLVEHLSTDLARIAVADAG